MKKSSMLSLGFIAISILAVLVFYWLTIKNEDQQDTNTLTSDEGGVTVTVTPITPLNPGGWQFEIELNTHSGELPEDLKSHAELLTDAGQTLSAFSWEVSSEQSHHQEGILSFSRTEIEPASIELILKGVGGVEERSFKWDLSN
ncbi:hypothetical protein IPG41_05305 [Candidatus Peregrinibacteria bacterium]|nr:MAG: hypothetical protein IPG41_05305 [Candidatus Peregrinibacteria bacterium]